MPFYTVEHDSMSKSLNLAALRTRRYSLNRSRHGDIRKNLKDRTAGAEYFSKQSQSMLQTDFKGWLGAIRQR
jgi:hypothetical protein